MAIIIGCDFHPGYQQIAMMDEETGEFVEKTLYHDNLQEVRPFTPLPGGLEDGV
jgi:hypothetical protein